jgi:hypothetical protein
MPPARFRVRTHLACLALCEWLWLGCGGPQDLAQTPADTSEAATASALLASTNVPTEGANATAHSSPSNPVNPSGASGAAVSRAAADDTASRALPSECSAVGQLCLPPRAFVRRLCQGASTGAAFHLLQRSTPFSRGYVRASKVPPVNALGGPSSDAPLQFGEEVLILTRTGEASANQMQVSGMGGYDVLRWDGTCANLADGELVLRAPIPPKHAPIEWRDIDASIQDALLKNGAIREARKAQRQHCHGVSLGTRSAECERADARLVDLIVQETRGGFALPALENIP